MNISPPPPGRVLPFLGFLLIAEGALWAPWYRRAVSPYLEAGYVAGLLVVGVFSGARRNAPRSPVPLRILFLLGVVLTLLSEIVRSSPYFAPPIGGLGTAVAILLNLLESSCLFTSSSVLLGSALALLDDPGHSGYREWSRLGAIVAIAGFAISGLADGLFALLYGTAFLAQLSFSVPVACSLVGRLGLFASVVLALRQAEEGALRLRRQRRIALLLLLYLAAEAAASISFALTPAAQLAGGGWRTVWLTSTLLTLLLLDSLLFCLGFRKPPIRYNSAASLNSSTGAEA